jgi:predicted small secreted protein
MRIRTIALTLALALAATGLTACREEGPAEKVGEKIDRTTDAVKDKLTPDGPAEKTGKKIDRAIDDATK